MVKATKPVLGMRVADAVPAAGAPYRAGQLWRTCPARGGGSGLNVDSPGLGHKAQLHVHLVKIYVVAQWNDLKEKDLAALNDLIAKDNIPAIGLTVKPEANPAPAQPE